MIGADLVGGVGKPAPDVYLRACADLGADPARARRARGLGPRGRRRPRRPGMVAVAVPSRITRFNDFAHADLVVDSVADLTVDAARGARRPGDRARTRR